jgi:hypothetical protein
MRRINPSSLLQFTKFPASAKALERPFPTANEMLVS